MFDRLAIHHGQYVRNEDTKGYTEARVSKWGTDMINLELQLQIPAEGREGKTLRNTGVHWE